MSQPATLEQLAVAQLIESRAYDRHLRMVRRRYRERRDVLSGALAEAGPGIRWEGVAAGMQAVLGLEDAVDDTAVVASLAVRGVEVVALSAMPSDRRHAGWSSASGSRARQCCSPPQR